MDYIYYRLPTITTTDLSKKYCVYRTNMIFISPLRRRKKKTFIDIAVVPHKRCRKMLMHLMRTQEVTCGTPAIW